MTIQLYKAATGEKALVVNHQLIFDGESEDDSAALVEQIGERDPHLGRCGVAGAWSARKVLQEVASRAVAAASEKAAATRRGRREMSMHTRCSPWGSAGTRHNHDGARCGRRPAEGHQMSRRSVLSSVFLWSL